MNRDMHALSRTNKSKTDSKAGLKLPRIKSIKKLTKVDKVAGCITFIQIMQ